MLAVIRIHGKAGVYGGVQGVRVKPYEGLVRVAALARAKEQRHNLARCAVMYIARWVVCHVVIEIAFAQQQRAVM